MASTGGRHERLGSSGCEAKRVAGELLNCNLLAASGKRLLGTRQARNQTSEAPQSGTKSSSQLQVAGRPAQLVHLNDHLVVDRGPLRRVRDGDDEGRALGSCRHMTAAMFDREVQSPALAMNTSRHLSSVDLHGRPLEPELDQILFERFAPKFWI